MFRNKKTTLPGYLGIASAGIGVIAKLFSGEGLGQDDLLILGTALSAIFAAIGNIGSQDGGH